MHMIPGAEVQAVIARHVLGDAGTAARLGDVTLHSHQREGANRARHLLDAFGGALIADDVGMGKTYLALAVARDARAPVVIAPAALRSAWNHAMRSSRVALHFVSLESLAHGTAPGGTHDLVVIDEAQHLRNPATRGFAACRALCATAKVLLLSATPVQNRTADLRVILSLFLGERAHALSLESLAAFIVRRDGDDISGLAAAALPVAEAPQWLEPSSDVDCLDRIVALPPPLGGADSGDGGALLTYTLVRQWASSRAAFRAALSRRLARACALEDTLVEGRRPTRAELASWTFSGGAQQLAFPLIATSALSENSVELLERVRKHRDAVRALATWLASTPDPDDSRAERLRELSALHPHRRIIAFSEYADTVAALYRLLAPTVRVAMLTHAGGRVAGGRTTRRDLLTAFAPGARERTHERDRVDLLLTTDVLSEGVGLQDASIVVHLDLPWNPARLAQRVGRVRRLGSAESTVLVFAMSPPAPAARMLELEGRLRRKIGDAARAVGLAGTILPELAPATGAAPPTDRTEHIAASLGRWRRTIVRTSDGPVCGAVRASRAGAIVCVRIDDAARLVAWDGRVVSEGAVADLISSASSESVGVDAPARDEALSAVHAWLRERRTTDVVDLPARRVAKSRRALLRRAERIAKATPRHVRATVSPLLFAARSAAAVPLSAGTERILHELTLAPLSDEAWLRALSKFAAVHVAQRCSGKLVALLLLDCPG
ncbi:MAG: DEAD/DEAH box helicase [Gemmatimonadota bacterium]